ncbi:MAG: DUF1963 domain-containing protein [Bacteroidota bacterium]
MQEYFKINGHDVGFADHPTAGSFYRKGSLDTQITVRSGKLKINLLTPRLDLADYLPPGFPEHYATTVAYLRLATYQDVSVPEGRYGSQLTYPKKGDRPTFEAYGLPGSVKFHGTITVQEGYVHVRGELRDYHYKSFRLPVEAVKTFSPGPLLPPRRRFTLEEAREIAPEKVYELNVNKDGSATFPTEILNYANLEYLWFGGNLQRGLPELPDGFFELRRLHTLMIYGHSLRSLPPTIGNLARLEELALTRGPLTELPDVFGKLNRLRSVSLEYNELTTIPTSLTGLPNLYQLNLKGNHFQSLPATLGQVPEVTIDRKHKKLYLDDRFKSNNPDPVDPSQYDLSGHPAAREQLAAAIDAAPDLEIGRELLLRYARMATYLVPTEGDIPVGNSKLGGAPDLPAGWPHPTDEKGRHFLFHAQLNCAELAPYQTYLPRTGLLYFYVNDEEFARKPLVQYADDTDNLRRYAYTEATEFTDADLDGRPRQPTGVRPVNAVSLPELYNSDNHGAERYPAVADLWDFADDDDAAYDRLEALEQATEELSNNYPDVPKHQFPFTARPYHALNAYVFTQHESPEEQAADRYGGEPEEWLTLLNLESIGKFSFWDAGTLTYCVHKKDLAIKDFSRVFTSIESS